MAFRFVSAFLFLAMLCPFAAAADQVNMHDGSIVSGKVTGLYNGVLGVETSFAGVLEVSANKIAGIRTDMPMIIETDNGERIIGTMVYDAQSGQRIFSKSLGAVDVNAADIRAIWQRDGAGPELVALREEREARQREVAAMQERHEAERAELEEKAVAAEEKADEVWSGRVKFGFAGADGNTDEVKLDGKAVAERKTDFDRLKLSLQGRYEKTEGEETKNETMGQARLERDINDRLFAFGALALEHDKFEDVDLRTNVTGGLGYFLIKKDTHELKPRLGVGYEVTAYGSDPTTKEVVLSAGYDYRVDMFEKLRFTHALTYLPVFDDIAEDYRIDSDAEIAYPIDGGELWNVELGLRNQYDAMPAAGVKKLDSYYSLGLARKFE